jgi:hypothetical protein
MALLTNSIFIANSYCRYDFDWKEYTFWNADIFETTIWVSSIKNTMISYIDKSIYDISLIIWYTENKWDFQEYFEIYVYNENFKTSDDYKNHWIKVWFWYVYIKPLKI